MVRDLKIVLILLLLAAFFVFAYSLRCSSVRSVVGGQPSPVNVQQTDKWVHIPNASSPQTTVNSPRTPVHSKTVDYRPPAVDSITHDTLYLTADTAQILRDYFTQHLYKEVYSDHLLDIEVTDSIFQNKLITQSVRYKTKPQASKIQVWAMATLDTRKTTSIHLLVKDKKERLFGVGYTSDKAITVSVGVPLFKTGGMR